MIMYIRQTMLVLALCISLIGVYTLAYGTIETPSIPNWIKNNAKWWSEGTVTDDQYVVGLQYLISHGIIKVSSVEPTLAISPLTVEPPNYLVTTIRTNSSYSTAFDSYGQISCKSNETLTGGGYRSSFHQSLSVYENHPTPDGKKWIVAMQYNPPSSHGTSYIQPPPFDVYALCTKLGS